MPKSVKTSFLARGFPSFEFGGCEKTWVGQSCGHESARSEKYGLCVDIRVGGGGLWLLGGGG